MPSWITDNRTLLIWIAGASLVLFFATLAAVPWMLRSIPADYFTHERRPPSRFAHHHPVWRWTLRVLRTVLAFVFLAAGTAMLVLPGQGLLTLLVGFLLLEFPGKYRFEKWCVGRPRVLRAVNALRRKLKREPMIAPARTRDPQRSDRASPARERTGHPQEAE
jgi:hypothetical protein